MQLVKVAELQDHPRNKEFFDDMEGGRWKEFLESIRTSGVVEPIVITETKTIVSGHQRVRACKELGIPEIMAEIHLYNGNDAQIVKDLIETNVRQRGTVGGTDRQIVARVEALNEFYGVKRGGDRKSDNTTEIKRTQCTFDSAEMQQCNENIKNLEDTARLAGTTGVAYRRSRQVLSADESIVDLVEAGNLSAKTVRELIIKLPKEEQQALASEIASGDSDKKYSKSDIEEMTSMYESRIAELETEKTEMQKEAVEAVKAAKAGEDSRRYLQMKEDKERAEEKYRKEYEDRRRLVKQMTESNEKSAKEIARLETKIRKMEAMPAAQVEVFPDDYEELKRKAEMYDERVQMICDDREGKVGLPESEKQRFYELGFEQTIGRAASELRGQMVEINRMYSFTPMHSGNYLNTVNEMLEMLEQFKTVLETNVKNEKEIA